MELRDIEIFLTLAEELHFGRTAERLRVTPARITQAIKKQERQIGAPLFERTNRTVRLTPLGRQLRDDLWPVYTGLQDGMRRAMLAAQGVTAVLRVGTLPINIHDLRLYWDTFRARHPQWKLQIQQASFVDPFAGLRRGDLDVLICWLPVEEPDLTVGPVLFAEPRVVAVAADHELTRFTSVSLEMVADFQHANPPAWTDNWADGYVPSHTRAGRRIERGPVVRNTEEVLTLASTGELVSLFPAHMRRYWSRPDIAYLSVWDIDVLPYALVWRAEAENDLIRALARVAADLGTLAL
ncbi:DNA-binding transcriptional regulator, LysR family [Streptosporangium subroseum]|uniref:DNA-binding transcriptional regulator, LysR family n=1 Tax=Streptosporangium subroseum TaxID=106412 RepID=A0A239LV19_9ACTN|nr:LysR family transcriptional regulator [Streptosporangium subroseum]SNT34311.1 DNA-binding transcriptional regulator, LysR family [Streptosporangium subroseum]